MTACFPQQKKRLGLKIDLFQLYPTNFSHQCNTFSSRCSLELVNIQTHGVLRYVVIPYWIADIARSWSHTELKCSSRFASVLLYNHESSLILSFENIFCKLFVLQKDFCVYNAVFDSKKSLKPSVYWSRASNFLPTYDFKSAGDYALD